MRGAWAVALMLAAACGTGEAGDTAPSVEEAVLGLEDPVPESCPLTVPGEDAFTPASEGPDYELPWTYEAVWYGTPELWTMIDLEGEIGSKHIWRRGNKTIWWSANYSPGDPAEITVTAEHLDGKAPRVEVGGPGGGGSHPFWGDFMLVGLKLPEPGCWEIAARYKGATLDYVVWVDNG
jgi:hypothetical protein